MPRFPKIESPCPYKGNLNDILEGDVCRLCQRSVTDLSAMSEANREAFYRNCSGDVCVSYRVSPKSALLAAMVAAGAGGVLISPAIAQDSGVVLSGTPEPTNWDTIIVGGIRGDHIELEEEPIDIELTDIPTITEVEDFTDDSGLDEVDRPAS